MNTTDAISYQRKAIKHQDSDHTHGRKEGTVQAQPISCKEICKQAISNKLDDWQPNSHQYQYPTVWQ